MATTLPTDVKYVDPFLQTGYTEKLVQNINTFNSLSKGGIVLRSNRLIGDFDYKAFFQNAGGLVSRQDQTSVAAVAAKKLTQANIISVKLNRKIGPVEWARSAFLKAGLDPDVFKMVAGQQTATDAVAEMLNTALAALRAALLNEGTNLFTVPASGTLTTSSLVSGKSKLGDQGSRIVAYIMHSKPYYDLTQYQINPTNNGDLVANTIAVAGQPVTTGVPLIVTDSPSLLVNSGAGSTATTDYYTIGLTEGALVCEETEEEYMTMDEVTGLEQIVRRLQGEYAYNLGVKGFTYDIANGGKNPNAGAVATGSNWDKIVTDAKDLAGVIIKSK